MDSPRSVTSEMSEGRTRLPASIANASKEELQRKLIEALKALKTRDKKLQQLVTVNENLTSQKDDPDMATSSSTKDALEIARSQNKSLAVQVQELSLSKQKHEVELEGLKKRLEEANQGQNDLQKAVTAAEQSLANERDKSQPIQEQIGSLKAALESMSIEREQAFEKVGEGKEHVAMLEEALAHAQVKIREQSSSTTKLQQELSSCQTQVTELESKMTNLSQDKEEAESKMSALYGEVDVLNAKCDADSEEIARLSDEWGKKESDLKEELEAMRTRLEEETAAHQETIRVAGRVTELESEISALKESQTSGDGTIAVSYAEELEKTAEKHRKRSEELEVEATACSKQNSEMAKRVEELEGLLKASKSENERLTESENLTCKELAQRLTQIEEFRRLEGQLRSDLCELEQQAHQAQAEVSDVEENLLCDRQTFDTERERWADQVQELQDTIEELTRNQGASEGVQYIKEQHEKEVSSLEEKISQLDTSWNTLNEKIAESETKISKMLADHDQERLEAEKAKFDLVGQLQKVTVQHAEEKEVLLKQTASFTAEVNDAKKIAGRVPDLEAEIASTNQALSRDAQKFQDEKSLLMQKLEEGKKDTVRLTHELEEKCSQLETAREALSTAEDSLNILKADLGKTTTDLEIKESEMNELKNQTAQLNSRLEAQERELGDTRDSFEADKDKMKKAVVELRKRLERAGAQQRKVELEAAELRGKLEGEKESLRNEVISCKKETEQSVTELKEYKLRAHTLLKVKETELQELKDSRDSNIEAGKHIEALREEADALASEKEAIQVQLEEQEASFSKHLDDLTADFRAQLDEFGAEAAHYRRACELATEEAEQWKAKSSEHENLATSYQQQLSGHMNKADLTAGSHDLEEALNTLREEHDSLRNTSERLQQSKDAEISRLLQANSELKAKLLDHPQGPSKPALSSAMHVTSDIHHPFTGDSVMTHAPDQVPDTFQFSNLINESEEIVSVASNSSKQDWVGGIEGGDAKIFALAQRQAGREEALASALKMNQRLEAEILDLEREVKLREEQEAVLKKALRDADRRQHQQDGLLENSIDMEYLKNTVVKLLETGEAEALLPVLARLLKLSVEEEGAVRVSLKATNDRRAQEGADASNGGTGILSSLSGWGWGSL